MRKAAECMTVEVVDIRKIVGGGKLRASADVKFGECIVVKGFTVIDGKSGLFVAMSRRADKDGRWYDVIAVDEHTKCTIENKILEAFNDASKA